MKLVENDYFFDCHCHTMTLGHVNITSFLRNLLKNTDWEVLLGLVGSSAQAASIPITTHCHDGGFVTVEYKQANRNTNPESWKKVLEQYPDLHLNFAHAGVSITPKFYKKFSQQLSELEQSGRNTYRDGILFGTDFMINLMGIRSYRDYYSIYQDAELDRELKHRFASVNPRTFLNLS